MTPAMRRALERAAKRERGNICPIVGCWANAETMLIKAMDRRGYIAWDGGDAICGVPRISAVGRAAIAEAAAA